MLKGTAEPDFGEWTHKVRTFMLARFGDDILTALTWAARQRKIVVKGCGPSQGKLRRETALYLGSLSLENKATKTNRATTLLSLLESSMLTLSPSQPAHPTEMFGTLEKEMAWQPGDDCTVSTTPRRP